LVAGALAVVKRQSELKISEANRRSAKLMREQNRRNAQFTPSKRDQPANEHRRVLGGRYFIVPSLLKNLISPVIASFNMAFAEAVPSIMSGFCFPVSMS
jgi:hypothetical protein